MTERCYVEGCEQPVVAVVDLHDGRGMVPVCAEHDPDFGPMQPGIADWIECKMHRPHFDPVVHARAARDVVDE